MASRSRLISRVIASPTTTAAYILTADGKSVNGTLISNFMILQKSHKIQNLRVLGNGNNNRVSNDTNTLILY